MKRLFLKLAAVTGMALAISACGGSDNPAPVAAAPAPTKNIVEIAVGDPQFSILVAALGKAGLVDALKGNGPFTVFAPTDIAFAAALAELNITKDQLIASPDLGAVLKYHVVPAKVLKADIPFGRPVKTLEGTELTIDTPATITDKLGRKSKITATDILATNGVIHVVDKVILPKLPTLAP